MRLRVANFILLVVLIALQGVLWWKDQTLIRAQQKTIALALQTSQMQADTIEHWKQRAMACEGLVLK
jgi:hypothetical protein